MATVTAPAHNADMIWKSYNALEFMKCFTRVQYIALAAIALKPLLKYLHANISSVMPALKNGDQLHLETPVLDVLIQ